MEHDCQVKGRRRVQDQAGQALLTQLLADPETGARALVTRLRGADAPALTATWLSEGNVGKLVTIAVGRTREWPVGSGGGRDGARTALQASRRSRPRTRGGHGPGTVAFADDGDAPLVRRRRRRSPW